MDVAEQALTALEMLSRRHSKAILHAVSNSLTILIILCMRYSTSMYLWIWKIKLKQLKKKCVVTDCTPDEPSATLVALLQSLGHPSSY